MAVKELVVCPVISPFPAAKQYNLEAENFCPSTIRMTGNLELLICSHLVD